jgi:5-methylcytosine-specific restriction endonuclease McrA
MTKVGVVGLFGPVELKEVYHPPSHKRRYNDYGPDWDELSNTCLLLANHICQDCHKNKATNAHHITPLTKGGANVLSNLKALCFYCHAKYHTHMNKGRRKEDHPNGGGN